METQLKLWLGVGLPVVVIILIAILGSIGPGLDVDTRFVSRLTPADVYENGALKKSIHLGDITIENKHFLSRRYDAPQLTACLLDKESVKSPLFAGDITYSKSTDIELAAHEVEVVKISLQPSYDFSVKRGEDLLSQYGDYDELVLVEAKSGYNSCYAVSEKTTARIPIVLA